MENSILKTIRKMIGGEQNGTAFDTDLLVCINTAFQYLHQIGVGPTDVFHIEGEEETWSDFIDETKYEAAKTYVFIRTKLLFDPPTNSSLLSAYKEEMREAEWRLMVDAEENVYSV